VSGQAHRRVEVLVLVKAMRGVGDAVGAAVREQGVDVGALLHIVYKALWTRKDGKGDAVALTDQHLPDGHLAVDITDIALTGPTTLGGRFLRSFWHPIAYAAELPAGHAQPIRLLSEDFTLYRGEGGAPHLVGFRCAHRRAQLSIGWVEGDCIRCYYHGWKYDSSGQCVDQPPEPTPFDTKVRIPSYPTREYLGLIFVYVGRGDPPPLPRYPDFEGYPEVADGQFCVEPTEESFVRRCNWFQHQENSLDPTHLGFVHGGRGGMYDGRVREDNPTLEVHESDWGLTIDYRWRSGTARTMQIGMPNVHNFYAIPYGGDAIGWLENLCWKVPIDDETHRQIGVHRLPAGPTDARVHGYHQRRAAREAKRDLLHSDLADAVLAGKLRREDVDPERTHIVAFEDDIAQVGQGRLVDRLTERLGRTDVGVILLRKILLRELRALSAGAPLKDWSRPPGLTATSRLA
jgi:5,5'-dehydrodivanillate O-demethylase